jgi:hypothetical protein
MDLYAERIIMMRQKLISIASIFTALAASLC